MKNQHYLLRLTTKALVILIFTVLSCSQVKKIDVQGHRGCRGIMPENSLPAFKKAIDLGVSTLELDIAITKNDEVIVSHEPFMSRFICLDDLGGSIPKEMDKHYNLYKMSYEEIKAFDCGSKFHEGYPKQEKLKVYKPLLKEVFALAKKNNADVNFNVEIKSKPEYYGIYTPEPERYVQLVLKEIGNSGMYHRTNLQSFDLNILEEIRRQSPDMPIALLVDEGENIEGKLNQLSFSPEIISPYYKLLSANSVAKYQELGYSVIPWTINSVSKMEELIAWNIDGIITDYPNLLLDILK